MHYIETGEFLERKPADILDDIKKAIKAIRSGRGLLATKEARDYYTEKFSQKQYKEKIWDLVNAK